MQTNTEIQIKGVREDIANELGEAVADVVRELSQELDFRRLRRIIITTDFAGELKELSSQTASKNPITHTNEEYGSAVAKVTVLPFADEFEIVPVIDAATVAPLLLTEGEENEDLVDATLHYLHHEFCHVHDNNKKIEALDNVILRQAYTGKDMFVGPLTEAVWSEYFANRMSSGSVPKGVVCDTATSFKDALFRTKALIDQEILSYRYHADLQKLMALFQRHGEFLVKMAAYVLGYVDGLNKPLSVLLPEAAEALNGSYFEGTWQNMHETLAGMYKLYPDGWNGLDVYDPLSTIMENYYTLMGLVLSTTESGGAYVHIPFRPETTPK